MPEMLEYSVVSAMTVLWLAARMWAILSVPPGTGLGGLFVIGVCGGR